MNGAAEPGVVYLVGGGPGDPGLFTRRGAELLASADVVLFDELVPPSLLDLARADAELRSVGKRGGHPAAKQASQEAIDRELVEIALTGKSVVRLKGGDPFLFGRGSEEAEALAEAGVRFEIVPGVTSPIGAAAYAGISLTHRDLASSVTFVSAVTRDAKGFAFEELRAVKGTLAVLMAMRRLPEVCEQIIHDARRDPSTPAAIVQWGTRSDQRVVEGRLDSIAEMAATRGIGSPAVLIVGAVVELRQRLRWFDASPLFGKRVLVARAAEQAGSTAELLRRRGAEPVEIPAIEIGPPPDPTLVRGAIQTLTTYDVVAFTSENGVRWFFHALDEERLDARAFGKARVAAIGPGTAAALGTRGIHADIVPASFIGEGVADAILGDAASRSALASGASGASGLAPRVLLPRARVAREVLPELLVARGCVVDILPVYETRPAKAAVGEGLVKRIDEGGLDAILLTSGSIADSVADMLGPRAAELSALVKIASIGPITTNAAERRGLRVAMTSDTHTIPALIAALEGVFREPTK